MPTLNVCRFLMLVLLLLVQRAIAAPAVTLSLPASPPTTALTVTGSGFGASKLIDIYFDTSDVCLAASNGVGQFSCKIKVPSMAQPGQHWFTAAERVSGTAAQKVFQVRTEWRQFHGYWPNRAGYNHFENTINAWNAADLDLLWAAPINAQTGPALWLNIAYIGGMDGKLYAFDALTAAEIAGFPKLTGGAIYSTPAVAGGKVYVGSEDGNLYAFNALTGAAIAGFPKVTGGVIYSSPAVAGGRVYVGSDDGKLYAFDAATGAAIAGFPQITSAFSLIRSSPAVASGRVYIGSGDGKLYAFNAASGAPVWSFAADSAVLGSPVVANGLVFVNSVNQLYALNSASGSLVWSAPATGSIGYASPALANGIVYFGSPSGLNAYSLYGELVALSVAARPEPASLVPDFRLKVR